MKPIDLCVDARMAFSSGIGRVIRELVPYLCQPPFRLHLLVTEKDMKRWSLDPSIRVTIMNAPIYSVAEQCLLPWKIPSSDLFWSPHFNVPLLPIRAKRRVVTLHDTYHLAVPLPPVQKGYAKVLFRRAFRASDGMVVPSDFTKEEVMRFLGRRGIEMIYNGLDHRQFHPTRDLQTLARVQEKYGLPDTFFLFVGNLKPNKNLGMLLQAYELFLSEGTTPLVVAGKLQGFRNQDVATQILSKKDALREKVKFLGEVAEEDLASLYQLATAFLFPSLYEGFGFPPLEAMACGCPTIVAKAASLPEVCGDAPLYASPFVPSEWVQAMRSVLSPSVQQERREIGLEQVKRYRWETAAEKYRQFFYSVCL